MIKCLNCGCVWKWGYEYTNTSHSKCPRCGSSTYIHDDYNGNDVPSYNTIIKKKCLNCGYERQKKDDKYEFVPSTECPRCHAIYEKVEKFQENKRERIHERIRLGEEQKKLTQEHNTIKADRENQFQEYSSNNISKINVVLTFKSRFNEVLNDMRGALFFICFVVPLSHCSRSCSNVSVGTSIIAFFLYLVMGLAVGLAWVTCWAGITYLIASNYGWIRNSRKIKTFLSYNQIKQLENIRAEYNISSNTFTVLVFSSSALGCKIIEKDYANLKKLYPHRDDRLILRQLLLNDFENDPDLNNDEMTSIEIAETAMKKINTLNDLCIYIESLERKKQPDYYESSIGQKIESIINKVS